MRYWYDQGVKRFILSVGYRSEQIERHFGSRFEDAEVDYVFEQQPMGTGGALLLCQERKALREPFLLLNGDTYFRVSLKALQEMGKKSAADWVLSLFPTTPSQRYLEIKLDGLGQVSFKNRAKQPQGGETTWANGGVYWVNPRALESLNGSATKISLESDLFTICIELGQLFFGLCSYETFIDIGVPEDFLRAQTMACFYHALPDKTNRDF